MKAIYMAVFISVIVFTLQSAPASAQVGSEDTKVESQANDAKNSGFSNMLSRHLPSWMTLNGELRLRGASVSDDFFQDRTDAYLLSRVRLNLQITPIKWLKFYVQGQDSHIAGANRTASLPPLQQDTMDLRLGYVEVGRLENGGFRLRVGRQELSFGEERLVGSANWLNTPRSFDGVSLTFRRNWFRLDTFGASVVKIHDGQFNENTPGNNIYGLYSSFSRLVPRADFQPYFFWRRQSGLTTEAKKLGISEFGTVGFRLVGKFSEKWDYAVEIAKQNGSLGADTIDAWAEHSVLGYRFSAGRFVSRVFTEYNYASGDHNSGDGKRSTFDQLFPSAHDLYGLTDQVGWKNIHHGRTGIEIKSALRWTVGSRYNLFWLADEHDALYNSASASIARSATGIAGRYVGQELDFLTSYKLNHWTTVAGGFGHLFPGTFLKTTTRAAGYSYPYASVIYTF